MSNHIEWVDAGSSSVSSTTTPGDYTDRFGSTNDGPALAFGEVVVEGTIEELRAFAAEIEQAVNHMEDDQ